MPIKIREMNEQDIEIIVSIWLEETIKAHPFLSEDYWKNNLEKNKQSILKSKVFVYTEDNEIQGFISLSGNYIEHLIVKVDYQKKGIGKALIKHCKNIFWSLMTKIYQENRNAVIFFEKQTFFVRDKMDNADNGNCQLFMEWIR